jgi:hypothetical protein
MNPEIVRFVERRLTLYWDLKSKTDKIAKEMDVLRAEMFAALPDVSAHDRPIEVLYNGLVAEKLVGSSTIVSPDAALRYHPEAFWHACTVPVGAWRKTVNKELVHRTTSVVMDTEAKLLIRRAAKHADATP